MDKYILLFLVLVCGTTASSQNEDPTRPGFMLMLPVDSINFYTQQVPESDYIVNGTVLQMYSGEELFIEVEKDSLRILSMKTVNENTNPDKTIIVKLSQQIEDKINKGSTLKITNPFDQTLDYDATMYAVGGTDWVGTSTLPVQAKLSNFEMWPEVVITLVLNNWKFSN